MSYYVVKVLVTVGVVVAASEIARKESFWASLLLSLPLTSLLALSWLSFETGDVGRVAALSRGIFWMTLPSLVLFLLVPLLLRLQVGLWASLALGSAATMLGYAFTLRVLAAAGVEI